MSSLKCLLYPLQCIPVRLAGILEYIRSTFQPMCQSRIHLQLLHTSLLLLLHISLLLPVFQVSTILTSNVCLIISSSSSLGTTVLPGAGSLLPTGLHRCLCGGPCSELDSYHQTELKRLWIEKTQEFPNVDVEYRMSWYKSMTTHFGKLSRLPTGSGAQELTERDEGIFPNLVG